MSAISDDNTQFNIPGGQTGPVDPQPENLVYEPTPEAGAYWTQTDAKFLSENLTGNDMQETSPHDEARWREALLSERDPLGLEAATQDVERRQRETDFNERQKLQLMQELCRQAVVAIDQTESSVLALRQIHSNDDGMVNGVKMAA